MAITHSTLGQQFYYTNRFEEAIVSFKKALALDSQFPRAHIFLGEIYLLQGKLEMALTRRCHRKRMRHGELLA